MQIIIMEIVFERSSLGGKGFDRSLKDVKGYEDKNINDYLQNNPHLFIKSFTSCCERGSVYNTYLLESLEDVSDMVENIPIVTGVKINDNSLGK